MLSNLDDVVFDDPKPEPPRVIWDSGWVDGSVPPGVVRLVEDEEDYT